MLWLIFSLLSAVFAAAINHVDKYLIEKYVKGGSIGSLAIFSSLMGLPVATLILLFNPHVLSIQPLVAFGIIINGIIYVAWLLPYLYALEKDEASVVTPLFQLSSLIAVIFGFIFLGETMTLVQGLAGLLILLGAIGLTLEKPEGGKLIFKREVFLLMALSSSLVALNYVLFKYFAISESFWVTAFWEYVGFIVAALFFLVCIKSYRKEFLKVIKQNRTRVLSINLGNEVLATMSKTAVNFASMLAPVALVTFVAEGFQPLFVVVFGVVLTLVLPKIACENLEKKFLVQKILSIAVIIAGTYLLG